MSCLSRLGCLTVLALGGAGAWWLYGGSMPSLLDSGLGRITGAEGSNSSKSRRPLGWASVNDNTASAAEVLGKLSKSSGPAFVTLSAPEVAAVLRDGLGTVFPASASSAQVAIDGELLRIRSVVALKELGGDAIPSLVGGLITDQDTVEIAGSLEVIRPGVGQFRVRQLHVRSIDIPPRLISPLMRSLRSRQMNADSLEDDAVGMPLPKTIADVRVSRGKLTLYKSVSKP